jgi:exodeoxyribonuclease VIII
MKPGIYDGITNDAYHGGPGVSVSGLKVIAERSPLHFQAYRSTQQADKEPSPAMMLGTAFHCLLLEPEVFVQDYCLGLRQSDFPDAITEKEQLLQLVADLNKTRLAKLSSSGTKPELVSRIVMANVDEKLPAESEALAALPLAELKAMIERLNEKRAGLLSTTGTIPQLAQLVRDAGQKITLWQDIKDEWARNNSHRTVLAPEVMDQLRGMRDAVMAHPAARALMTNSPGVAERSVYWVDQDTGELCRCRPDFWRQDGIIVDVKTTDDASPGGFAKSIVNFRYDIQAPFYLDGCQAAIKQSKAKEKPPTIFLFLAVEKNFPHAVAVYSLDEVGLSIGRGEYKRSLANYSSCMEANAWPGYGDKIQNISVPAWHASKNAGLIAA